MLAANRVPDFVKFLETLEIHGGHVVHKGIFKKKSYDEMNSGMVLAEVTDYYNVTTEPKRSLTHDELYGPPEKRARFGTPADIEKVRKTFNTPVPIEVDTHEVISVEITTRQPGSAAKRPLTDTISDLPVQKRPRLEESIECPLCGKIEPDHRQMLLHQMNDCPLMADDDDEDEHDDEDEPKFSSGEEDSDFITEHRSGSESDYLL